MGRFVYQPVPINMETVSKHGQLLADIYSGHISTNHNNVIVSVTQRIEDKLEDVFQIQDNIIEQKNNINNLNEDYYAVINVSYVSALNFFTELKLNTVIVNGGLAHLEKGMGESEATENTILNNLYDAISLMINLYEESANHEENLIGDIISTCSSTDVTTKIFALTDTVIPQTITTPAAPLVGVTAKYNLTGYLAKLSSVVKDQRADINIMRNNLLSKLNLKADGK